MLITKDKSISIENIAHNLAFVTFIFSAIGICLLVIIISKFLGSRSYTKDKNIPFESGIDSLGSARLRLSIKFYLIAMFFVIFDVETFYLLAWSISIHEGGWIAFIEIVIFILVLLISLIYLIKNNALEWTPIRSRYKRINLNK